MLLIYITMAPAGLWIVVGVGVLVLLTLFVTILAILLFWRNGYVRGWRAARAAPPLCPKCGYDLSGLSHCRCPECGAEYRLEELWRANPPSLRGGATG